MPSSTRKTSYLELVFENPLASDNVGMIRLRKKIPCVVAKKSSILYFHCLAPVGVSKGGQVAPWNR